MSMGYVNTAALNAVSSGTSTNGPAILTKFESQVSMQVVSVGSSNAGTAKLQFSNDLTNPTNWSDVTSGSCSISGAGVTNVQKLDICYEWMRVVYTNSAGAVVGTITARLKTLNFGLARD